MVCKRMCSPSASCVMLSVQHLKTLEPHLCAALFYAFQLWPTEEVPQFKDLLMNFQRDAHRLSLRVLYAIAIGLNLVSENYGMLTNS